MAPKEENATLLETVRKVAQKCAAIVGTPKERNGELKDANASFIGVVLYNAKNATEKWKLALAIETKKKPFSSRRKIVFLSQKVFSCKAPVFSVSARPNLHFLDSQFNMHVKLYIVLNLFYLSKACIDFLEKKEQK